MEHVERRRRVKNILIAGMRGAISKVPYSIPAPVLALTEDAGFEHPCQVLSEGFGFCGRAEDLALLGNRRIEHPKELLGAERQQRVKHKPVKQRAARDLELLPQGKRHRVRQIVLEHVLGPPHGLIAALWVKEMHPYRIDRQPIFRR